MKPISILLLATYPHREDPKKGVFNYRAVESLKLSVSLTVASIRSWRPGRKIITKEKFNSYTVYHLSIPHYPTTNKWMTVLNTLSIFIFMQFALRKVVKSHQIIHSVGASSYGIYGALMAWWFHKKHLIQLTGSDINSELPGMRTLPFLITLMRAADMVVGNSRWLVQEFNRVFESSYPLKYAYRGVDLKRFSYVEQETRINLSILFLGGLDEYKDLPNGINTKGGLTLMKAWKNAEDTLRQNHVRLLFGGPESDKEEFYNWFSTLKYPGSVQLIGAIPPVGIPEVLREADLVVIPSMEEGLPNVAVEASAVGRPVVGSNVGGIPEVVEPGITGFLFEAGNETALAEILCSLAQRKDEIKRMGLAARRKVELEFDQRFFANSYVDYYKEILQSCVG